MALNENGEPSGIYEFIDKVEVTLIQPGLGLASNQEVIIGQGRNDVELVWDAKLTTRSRELDGLRGPGAGLIGSGQGPAPVDIYPLEYSMGPGYPNPFN